MKAMKNQVIEYDLVQWWNCDITIAIFWGFVLMDDKTH